MITPKRPQGFNEFLPADQLAFNAMISVIKLAYEQHGYSPIETPALELSEILLAKEGGETAKQVYRFTKGDNDLTMRFDLTIPLARYVAEHYHDLTMPFKRYQIQEVWRAEKAQAGRYRQFYQCDIDIIGSNSIMADADILLTAHSALKALGLPDAVFNISHRGVLNGFLEDRKLSSKATDILRAIDKLSKQGEVKVSEELEKINLKKDEIKEILILVKINGRARDVIKELTKLNIKNSNFIKALEDITELDQYLQAGGLKNKDYIFDLRIVRGFDYYTGLIFETILTKNPLLGSICGGGRYDNLVGYYSKENLAGVGTSIGLSRLFSAIKDRLKTGPATPAQALIISFAKETINYSLEVASILNKANLNAFVYPKLAKADKQLSYANKLGIKVAVLCGENEMKKKSVTIKDMTTGKQTTVSLKKASQTIRKMV